MRGAVSKFAGVVLATTLLAGSALAQEGGGIRAPGGLYDSSPQKAEHMVSVMAVLPYYFGFGIGVGGRYTLPLAPDGVIPEINESFEAEFGLDFAYSSWGYLGFSYNYFQFVIPAEIRWTFHITPKFDAYAKFGLGYALAFGGTSLGTGIASPGGFWWNTASGILYELSDSMSLRFELGYWGLRAGLGFKL